MRQMWRALLAVVVMIAGARAQSRSPAEDLIDRIKGLPPEFAAKLLLHVEVVVNKLPPKQRIALYEEAFRLAAHAELATPLQGTGFHTETRPGWQQTASEAELDSLTLQYRAMGYISRLDPSRLQRLFQEMRPVPVQPQSCDEILRPEFSNWTGAINLVYQRGFNAAERSKELDIAFVEDQVRSITSPLQLPALANLFAQADRRLLPRLSAAHDAAIAQVRGDWFAFQYAAGKIGRSRSSATAYHDYIVAHLRGPRCGPRWPYRKQEEPEDVTRFNEFARHNEDLNLQSLDAAQIQPSRIEDSPSLEEFWQSEKSKQLMEDLRWLTHGNRKLPNAERFWNLEERRSMGWNERYLEF